GRRCGRRGMESGVAEVTSAEHVLDDADHHADATRRKTDVPVAALSQIPADQGRDERAEIDPHVEDRESRIAAAVLRTVEAPDDHADVAFEQTGADNDEQEDAVELRERWKRHREVAARDEDAAVQDGAALTD